MGILKDFFSQTRRPQGLMGRIMAASMNSGHSKMAEWGMERLPRTAIQRAADLGCGGGRNAGELLKRYPDCFVSAADYSEVSVETAEKCNRQAIAENRMEVRQEDVSDLHLEKNSYDLATAFETVYFWPGLAHCFSQVASVLKDGGYFLIVNESDGLDDTAKKFEKMIDGMKLYTMAEIIKALEEAGFEILYGEHHPKNPWIRILAKKKNNEKGVNNDTEKQG